MRTLVFLLAIMTGASLGAHPLHLSITNISIQDKEILISMKTFRDDWETAYFHFHSRPIDFSDPVNRQTPWFREYLEQSFRIATSSESTSVPLMVDTITVSEENMVIEMRAALREEPKSLYIYNALLTDIFPDQTNLVMIGIGKRETGIKFDIKKREEKISLQ